MNPKFISASKILSDYYAQKELIKPFYAQGIKPDWQKLSAEVCSNFKQHEVLTALAEQNASNSDAAAQKNKALLLEKNTCLIVTGQQAGLLVSPLYIIYKALTTIWLAKRLNTEIPGYNYVPVFWLEGEDHDFEEVAQTWFFNRPGELIHKKLAEQEGQSGFSMNKRIFDEQIIELIMGLPAEMLETDFSAALFEKLQSIYKKGANWIDAFKMHLQDLFSGSGMLFFSAGDKKVKALSIAFFKKAILENDRLHRCFEEDTIKLEQAGYSSQVTIQEDRAYLFLSYEDKARQALIRTQEGFYIRESDKHFTTDELLHLLDENPHWFSSTVLTRPLWQSYLLPTLSYVAGPAEVAYWGQLRGAFDQMALIMPQVQPRHSVTLLEPKTRRLLQKHNLKVEDIPADEKAFLKDFFKQHQMADVDQAFHEFEQQAIANRDKIQKVMAEIDPTMQAPIEKTYGNVLNTLGKLQNRLISRVQEQNETTRNQLMAIHEAVLPAGKPQERILGVTYLQNKYGSEWLDTVLNNFDENFERHLIVEL